MEAPLHVENVCECVCMPSKSISYRDPLVHLSMRWLKRFPVTQEDHYSCLSFLLCHSDSYPKGKGLIKQRTVKQWHWANTGHLPRRLILSILLLMKKKKLPEIANQWVLSHEQKIYSLLCVDNWKQHGIPTQYRIKHIDERMGERSK